MQSGNTINFNGTAIGQSSIIITINGEVISGVTDIDLKSMQDKDNEYGAGDSPVYTSYGNVTFEGSITLFQNEIESLRKAVKLLGYKNSALWNASPFILCVIIKPFAGQMLPKVHTAICEFKSDGFTSSQGDKALKMQLDLLVKSIEYSKPV